MEGNSIAQDNLCNGEVNANKPKNEILNGQRSDQRKAVKMSSTKGKTRPAGMISLFSSALFFAECLLCYAVILTLLLPLIPLVATYLILKTAERVIVKSTTGGIALSGLDALWQQSSDENRLAINGLVIAENDLSFDEGMKRFRDAIAERMVDAKKDNGELLYPRTRYYIRPGYFQYFFQEDKSFRIENHVFKWEGETPCSKDELAAIVSKLSNEPFPEGRSPWYFCCVPTNFGDNDMATVFRMSHSIADGVALVEFLTNQLTDQRTPQKQLVKFSSNGRSLLLAKALLMMPRHLIRLFLSFADRSFLHGPKLSGVKKVAWQEAFELQLVKQIKTATGTTINDVLMSCLSLALRRYFQRRGVANPNDFTASIPVDVRSAASRKELTFENKFSIIFLKLAVATEDVLKLLHETKARMDDVKTSGEPLAAATLMFLTNELFPEFLIRKINTFVAEKASCVLSNVPGPQHLLTVSGYPVKYMTFWSPQRDNVGLGLSIHTYAGKVIVGVQGDAALLSDPEVITEEFGNALNEMARCVLHSDGETNGNAAH